MFGGMFTSTSILLNHILKFTLVLLVGFLCSSCGSCLQQYGTFVYDSESMEPVEGVFVDKKGKLSSYSPTTDKLGFVIWEGTGGGVFSCPEPVLYFEKEGYKTTSTEEQSDTIFMEPSINMLH